MSYEGALKAAKKLAKSLKLTSRWGSVIVALTEGKYVIILDADAGWRERMNIPDTYYGYEVAQQDRTIGRAYG